LLLGTASLLFGQVEQGTIVGVIKEKRILAKLIAVIGF